MIPLSQFSVDVNECELETHSCSTAANCDNVAGSYVCTCQKGYTGDGLHCVPIDYGMLLY